VKQDDELHEVRVSLLPEWLLSFAEEVVEERSDTVGEGVSVQVVVKRVVSVFRMKADLNVVFGSPVAFENALHLVAEIAFDFEHQGTNPFRLAVGLISEELFGEGIHAATSLAGSHCAQNGDSGKKSTLGNREPIRLLGGAGSAWIVNLTHDEKKLITFKRLWVWRKRSRSDAPSGLESEDVKAREKQRIGDVGVVKSIAM
jgi:hypothetical protein